ncbi:MAG: IS1634 family transposase, partial [Desulfobacterales bacterium]
MFIRAKEKKNKNSNKIYYTHKLVESVRTERGPRQRILLNLGTLDLEQKQWKPLANRIEELLAGQRRLVAIEENIEALAWHFTKLLVQKKMAEKNEFKQSEQDFQSVDVNALASSEGKSIGSEHVGLEAMKQLGFFKLFRQLRFKKEKMDLATLLIIGRLVHPCSERELKRYAEEESGLDELLKTDFSHLANNALYETSDILFSHKDTIEQFLRNHSKKLLGLGESIILYDLTNTYFEGDIPFCEKAKHGRSKDKRNDRPLVTLGIVLDENGFLKTTRIFEGNISEPKTLMDMVHEVHGHAVGQQPPLPVEKPTVVIDAGIASEDNLTTLKEHGFSYIVVSRSKPYEIPIPDFVEIKKGIKVHSFKIDDEIFLHCLSEAKTKKEQSMVNKARDKMEKELLYLREGLNIKRRLKRYDKVLERIGRLRNQYNRVSRGFDIQVKPGVKNAVDINWQFDEKKLGKPYDGTYFLRTDRNDLDDEKIWSIYIMLTIVEDAFRCLKDELGLRPNFHHKPDRIDGHIFITVLAYHLLHLIRYKLNEAGLFHRFKTIKSWLNTHRILTTSLPKERGGVIHIRHCTTPTLKQQEVYSA